MRLTVGMLKQIIKEEVSKVATARRGSARGGLRESAEKTYSFDVFADPDPEFDNLGVDDVEAGLEGYGEIVGTKPSPQGDVEVTVRFFSQELASEWAAQNDWALDQVQIP